MNSFAGELPGGSVLRYTATGVEAFIGQRTRADAERAISESLQIFGVEAAPELTRAVVDALIGVP